MIKDSCFHYEMKANNFQEYYAIFPKLHQTMLPIHLKSNPILHSGLIFTNPFSFQPRF